MSDLLKTLTALDAAATPGPWIWTLTKQTTRSDVLAYFAECYDKCPEGPLHGCDVPTPGHQIEDESLITAITGNGPTSEQNARLIIAMRNAMPEILAALRGEGEGTDV